MGVVFKRDLAYRQIEQAVDTGIEITAGRIQGLAKSLAPVRKTRPWERGRNRANPLPVGFYQRSTGKRIETREALAAIGNSFRTPASWETVARSINKGDRDRYNVREGGREVPAGNNSANIMRIRRQMARMGIVARVATRGRLQFSSDLRGDVSRLRGVQIDPSSGRAVVGGTLRNSIKAGRIRREGKKISVTVRAGAPYAKYVEFKTVRTRAQPFLLPAFKTYGTVPRLGREIKKVRGG